MEDENKISQNKDEYTFLNGQSQGDYESEFLSELRVKAPNRKAVPDPTDSNQNLRPIAQTEAQMKEVMSFCTDIPQNMAKRLLYLRQLQELMHETQPER